METYYIYHYSHDENDNKEYVVVSEEKWTKQDIEDNRNSGYSLYQSYEVKGDLSGFPTDRELHRQY